MCRTAYRFKVSRQDGQYSDLRKTAFMLENSDHQDDEYRLGICSVLLDHWKCCNLNLTEEIYENPWPRMRRNVKIEYNKA